MLNPVPIDLTCVTTSHLLSKYFNFVSSLFPELSLKKPSKLQEYTPPFPLPSPFVMNDDEPAYNDENFDNIFSLNEDNYNPFFGI